MAFAMGETGKVVVPERDTETFISSIGHLDGRIDLYKAQSLLLLQDTDSNSESSVSGERSVRMEMGNQALMDLCIMASKLAYENSKVIKNVVLHHWKASKLFFFFFLRKFVFSCFFLLYLFYFLHDDKLYYERVKEV